MKYSIHPAARLELLEAIAYYEECRDGLGLEFSREVYSSIDRVVQFPLAWSEYSEDTRRCLTKRFPYGLIYQIIGEEILIIAVTQLNREPGYWEGRLK
jgi:hypothetical protein